MGIKKINKEKSTPDKMAKSGFQAPNEKNVYVVIYWFP